MVRPSGAVYTYLPEPPGWRAHPPGRLPSDATDPCWSLDPAPPAEGSRPLAIVEVVDYDLFVLGTSRVIELDPVGVLAERLGDEAVQRVRRALRESRTYPSLSDLSGALLMAIFGERGPSGWLFEAIVSPHVYATRTLWDTRLLGRRKLLGTYRDRGFELDTSPDLACCNMDVLHPVSRPLSDARRHWTVRICQITPLVRKELTDGEAKAMLQRLLDQESRDPSRLAVGHIRRGHGDKAVSKPARPGGDAPPERDHGCGAPPSRDGASGSGPGGREGAGSGGCEGAGSGGGGGGGALGDDSNLLRVLELLERRDELRSRREWAEADRIKEELVALHVRLDDRNKKYSIRPPRGSSSSVPSGGAAPSLGADPRRAKPRKKPRTATLQVGRVVFLRPGRLPGGASPHQPHLILEETWPLRGDRGCRTTRHFRLQPQPSGEPFLLEEDAVTALYNGFRDAWLAMQAAGDAAQRETLLRALSWYCEEYAQPPLACIRLLLHSEAVSREQALELAAEMRALTGVGGEGYASDGEEPAGARPSLRRGCEEAHAPADDRASRPTGAAAAPPPARNTLGRVPFAAGDVVWLRSEITPRAMLVLGHTAWEGGGARSWLRLKALPTAEGGGSKGGSNGGNSAASALPRLPEPEELTADEAAPVEYVVPFDQLRDVGLGQVLPAPGGADEGGARPVEPERPLVPRRNNVELMREALEAKGGASVGAGAEDADAEDCHRQESAAQGDEARMEQPAASAGGEAGCIPHGVVLHSGGAAGSGGSFVTDPTAAPGSGSKRKRAADADGGEAEIAGHHRAERRQRDAPGEVVVPASHRAAVLEGLRRVLVKEGGDPEEWWERNGTGGLFPFEVELAGP